MRRVAVWSVLVAVSLVAPGCGDDGDTTSASTSTSSGAEETTVAPDDEGTEAGDGATDAGTCEMLTVEAVSEVFGEPAELDSARPYVCSFVVGDVTLEVQRFDGGVDPEDTSVASCAEGTRVEVEAGDAAHVCLTEAFPAPFGAVSRGDVSVWIGTAAGTDEAVRDRIAELLPLVTVPA